MNAIIRAAAAALLAAACSKAESADKGKEPGGGAGPPPMPVEVAVAALDTIGKMLRRARIERLAGPLGRIAVEQMVFGEMV